MTHPDGCSSLLFSLHLLYCNHNFIGVINSRSNGHVNSTGQKYVDLCIVAGSMQWERLEIRREGEAETNGVCNPNSFDLYGFTSLFSAIIYGQSGGINLVKPSGL